MAKNGDWGAAGDVKDLMEQVVDHYPSMFEGFNVSEIFFIMTQKKKSKVPIKVHAIGYPHYIASGKPYIVEVFEKVWRDMDVRQQHIAIFDAMNFFPDGGFDELSDYYGKKVQPGIKMHFRTFAATGGIPDWMDNPAAKDPLGMTPDEVIGGFPGAQAIPESDIGDAPSSNNSMELIDDRVAAVA